MARPARLPELFDEAGKGVRLFEAAIRDGVVDTGQVLPHHAARPEVHVADLGVAHLPVRQPDVLPGAVEHIRRPGLDQAVPIRCVGKGNRVAVARLALRPAVENAEHRRAAGLIVVHAMITLICPE